MTSLLHIGCGDTAAAEALRARGFDVYNEAPSVEPRTPFDVAMIASDVEAPLRVARTLRGAAPEAHIVFLTTPSTDAGLRRDLLLARLGTEWSIAPAADPRAIESVVRQAIDATERRRRFRTTLGRMNSRLAEPAAAPRRALISDHFLATVLDQLSDAVMVLDPTGHVLAYNGTASRAFGAIRRGAFLEALPAAAREALAIASREGQAESLLVTHDKVEYGLRASALRDDAGAIIGMALVARDITALRAGERRKLLVAQAVRVLSSTLDARIALQRLTDLLVQELAELALADVAQGEQMVRYAVSGRTPHQRELMERVRSFDSATNRNHPTLAAVERGEISVRAELDDEALQQIATSPEHLEVLRELRPHSMAVVPLRTGQSTIGAILVARSSGAAFSGDEISIVQEIAREATGALHNIWAYHNEAETNRVKDEFLATLSHELRTPMTAILGWSQLLPLERERDKLDEGLRAIERSARAQAQLIDDLLDLSRIQMGKMQFRVRPFSLAGVARAAVDTVRPAAHARGVALRLDAESDAVISGDPDRMQQVIWNLLSNAVKFSDRGGEVIVTVAVEEGMARVTVADRGRGIDPAFVPHVFERFRQADSATTRRFGGLGLGLAIVKQLVEMHGGTIEAASEGRGKGAAFTLRVPLSTTRPDEPEKPAPVASLSGARVLLVEDEPSTASIVKAMLEHAGARVRVASSAAEALDALREELPDLLVSDVGMPDEDGLSLIRTIRGTLRIPASRLPAAALTAFSDVNLRMTLLASGFQQFLMKPIEPEALTNALAALLR
ncbi:MAG TPA: ATP-binding protein [Thermoanaerobaculia bacterium]|jgi:signal transduction histidine kinase